MEDAPIVPVMGAPKQECHKGKFLYRHLQLQLSSSSILYILNGQKKYMSHPNFAVLLFLNSFP